MALIDPTHRQHAVFLGDDGRARVALTQDEADKAHTRPMAEMDTAAFRAQYVHEMVKAIRLSPHDTILIFIHGGLNSHEDAYATNLDLLPRIEKSGYYPLFIDWNSAALPTLGMHLFRIRQGEEYGWFSGAATAPFVLAADLGKGIGRAPISWLHQVADYCRTASRRFNGDGQSRAGAAVCPVPGLDRERRAAIERIKTEEQQAQVKGFAVADPLRMDLGEYHLPPLDQSRRDAIGLITAVPKLIFGPLVDGLGTGAWQDMLRRTKTMFRAPDELLITSANQRKFLPKSGAVSVLLDSLAGMISEQETLSVNPRHRRVILAGHSMGAIISNRILREYPQLPIDRIYYMAAAASVADVEDAVIPFLVAHPTTLFYNGMLHPFADAGEWQPQFLDLVPRGSLLEWIDDYFQINDTPLDRTAGKWTNFMTAQHVFPAAVRSRVLMKSFGVNDPVNLNTPIYSQPDHHGAFSELEFWKSDFWAIKR